MASTFNHFCLLDNEDQIKSPQSIELLSSIVIPVKSLDVGKSVKWGDMEDDPIDDLPAYSTSSSNQNNTTIKKEPVLTINKTREILESKNARMKINMSDEEKQELKAFDVSLSKKRELEVTHNVRVYNKETKEVSTDKNTRKFRIVSKSVYDSINNLIGKYKTHNGGKLNFREQAAKIKLTNSLMEMAYKDPKVPCCFIYPVCVLSLSDSGKTLTRNEIHRGSKCYFEISDICYYPSNNIQKITS